ncbi:site-specific DNA-methyltransferase [Flavobacterium sp.]|uniref:site-specific DNA-methyltransferase n=1 Tax=Flavobacterium sp. TaxID=239 RepID=UPI003BCA8278
MTNYDKLINTLKEVFMLDKAELDFGIYRIMNQKRKDIEQFLEVDLVPQVHKVLSESLSVDKQALQKELDDAIKSAQALGADPNSLPKVQDLKRRLGEAADMGGIENEVFSLLANFFKRYFDNGDFISMRRYKKDVYAIPYEGEEVKLHWANSDQYYIKTSEYFKVYRFKLANGKTVAFELIEASTEQNNNKTQGDKERRFAIYTDKVCEAVGDEFKIYFTYEPADKKIKQSDLLEQAFDAVKTQIPQGFTDLLSLRPTEKDKQRSLLQKHLLDYTARNTFDYFIHKDLGGFLTRELDFYIKNEVLFIDDLNTRDEQEFLKQLSKIKAIKKIGEKIIIFLAQLENFQKKLWLKKKMVVQCNYCITLDRVPKDLYAEILNNQAQIQEWIKLFAIDEIKAQAAGGLFPENKVAFSNPLTLEFLDQNKFLILDTAFFSETFKWQLIGSIEKFDEQCDGLLINSENFQALSFLFNKYSNTIDGVYIDPPYNTNSSEIAYKNNYKHSSWLSLISNRVEFSNQLVKDGALHCVTIDDLELPYLWTLLNNLFGIDNHLGSAVIRINPGGRKSNRKLALQHEYAIFMGKGDSSKVSLFEKAIEEKTHTYIQDENGNYYEERNLRKEGQDSLAKQNSERYFSIYYDPKTGRVSTKIKLEVEILPIDTSGNKRIWRRAKDDIDEMFDNGDIFYKLTKHGPQLYFKFKGGIDGEPPRSFWEDKKFSASEHGTQPLDNILGTRELFSFPKSIYAVEDCIKVLSNRLDAVILDYFSGSATTGHAIINLNREDNGNRKFILVEMGTYFDTVTKPRIQKVIYSKDWKDGKPLSREGISHCFKYMRLESYEDTLNNLALKQTETQQKALEMNPIFKEGYMLNYMLDVETKESLLNLEWFVNPFNCYLNITKNNELQPTKVDLVETFNYLIGLVVENYAVPKEGYVVVVGKNLAGESILVVWRDCKQHNSAALNQFLEKSKYNPLDSEYDRIYVNGDNNVENLKTGDERWKVVLIEEEFGKRMFEQN